MGAYVETVHQAQCDEPSCVGWMGPLRSSYDAANEDVAEHDALSHPAVEVPQCA